MKRMMMLFAAFLAAGSVAAQGLDPMQPIPQDPEVRVGKLDNGMSYYIRHNEKPKGQADFYILHNVGAIQEEDSQQGLAHFLEHMAFNGTKNLPGKRIIEYLETVGVKFGYNLNAATSWDHTIYNLSDVPTAREGVIDSALLILHDWSHFIALEPAEIDSERGVIMEELRTRDGAQWRSTMKLIQAVGKDSKYEHRNLIGYLDGLKSFHHKELEDFYHQWYRPDYQAVIVVGDVDAAAVEQKIRTLMADIPAPEAGASLKETYVVPGNTEPIVSIYTDPEMQGSRVQIFIKREATPNQFNNLIAAEMINVFNSYVSTMENARLQEIAMQPDAPFLGAGMSSGDILGIIPTMETTAMTAVTKDGHLAEGFAAIYAEMEKIRRYGFTQSEFERAKSNLMRQVERGYANRNDRTNEEFVNSYVSAYTKNRPIPDADTEWQLDSMLLNMVNVDMLNAYAQQIITPENQVIIITAPEKEGVANPSEADILAIREQVSAMELAAYEDNTVVEPLIAEEVVLKGSPVKKTTENKAYGTTEWTLKNGIRIVVKPTLFKADEVRFCAEADGGLSNLSDEEFYMGELMPTINAMSGVGKFSATDLRKQLSGKAAQVGTSVTNYASQVVGSCSPKDIETMLQLVYLNFTQPRFDANDYRTLMTMLRSQLENAESNPDFLMEKRFQEVAYGNNPRRQVITTGIVDKFDFEALPSIYAKLFPDAGSFLFMFVGNVDLETLKPLVEKYIGSLPVAKRRMTYTDDRCSEVKGDVREQFAVAMQQPKVSIHYRFSGEMPYTIENRIALNFLTQALSARYLTSIREERGGAYTINVQGKNSALPAATYFMDVAFDTNDEMADELQEIVLAEIRKIAEEGPLTEDIEKHREFMLKNLQSGWEQNGLWMNFLLLKYANQNSLDYVAGYEQALRSVSNADVQALARKILDDGNLIRVVMRPEK